MLENNCSEQASRMAAMESSTKNAKEMLSKLTLSYNRYIPQPQSRCRPRNLQSSNLFQPTSVICPVQLPALGPGAQRQEHCLEGYKQLLLYAMPSCCQRFCV